MFKVCIYTQLEVTRLMKKYSLPYSKLLGFEKPLLVIACTQKRLRQGVKNEKEKFTVRLTIMRGGGYPQPDRRHL